MFIYIYIFISILHTSIAPGFTSTHVRSSPPRGPPPWRIGLVPGRSRRRSDSRPTRTPPGSLKKSVKSQEISGNINEYQWISMNIRWGREMSAILAQASRWFRPALKGLFPPAQAFGLFWVLKKEPCALQCSFIHSVCHGLKSEFISRDTLWLFNIAMERSTIFKFGKPSISTRAIYTMASPVNVITSLGKSTGGYPVTE